MSSPLWRAILWVEQYLPSPRPVPAPAERSGKAGWWATLVPLFAVAPTFLSVLMRRQPELGEVAVRNRILLEQLALVFTGCVVLATIGFAVHFGMRAWRDAREAR